MQPSVGHNKYLQLAQLLEGKESLAMYESALSLIPTADSVLISFIFCSMAEIYLTDLCFEDNAEVECERN